MLVFLLLVVPVRRADNMGVRCAGGVYIADRYLGCLGAANALAGEATDIVRKVVHSAVY